jgi:hypothetical protein
VHEVHQRLGCHHSAHTYYDAVLRKGFYWPNMSVACDKFRKECTSCAVQAAAMRNNSCDIQAPGADYTLREIFNEDPMSCVIIDETGPCLLANRKKVCALMVVELVTGRVTLLAMNSTNTEDLVRTLSRLQAIRGGLSTVVLDAAASHKVIANTSSRSQSGGYIRSKLNKPETREKLADLKIKVKVVPANAHHQAGLAENISRLMKVFNFNVLQGMRIKDELHYQEILDIMSGCMNNRTRFIDNDGCVHTSNTFMQAALRVARAEPQDLTQLANTDSRKINSSMKTVAEEIRRVLTIFGAQQMKATAAWQAKKFGKQPKINVGDVVVVLDRIILHHYRSARRAIGRVMQVSTSGQSFRIKMVTQGPHDRRPPATKHRKHLLLLVRGEDLGSGVIPLDPFADQQVNDLLSQPKLELEAAFFSSGLDKIPEITKAEREMAEFKDPEDAFTLFHLDRPFNALDMLYPTGHNKKNKVVISHEEQLPNTEGLKVSETAGVEQPHTVTRRGRRVVAPRRYGI